MNAFLINHGNAKFEALALLLLCLNLQPLDVSVVVFIYFFPSFLKSLQTTPPKCADAIKLSIHISSTRSAHSLVKTKL